MEKYEKVLKDFRTQNEISINHYKGYCSLHIDINYKNKPIIWLNIDKDKKMKICKIEKNVIKNNNKSILIATVLEIARALELKEIFGRIDLDDEKNFETLFQSFGFFVEEKYDKEYRTAKIKLLI